MNQLSATKRIDRQPGVRVAAAIALLTVAGVFVSRQLMPSSIARLHYNQPLDQLLGTVIDKSKVTIAIQTSKHTLTLYYDHRPIKSYPAVFGDPVGDKLQEGDRKTPEGHFQIQDAYPHPTLSKFLWLNYPTQASWQKHKQAQASGAVTPNAAIGGEIGIHGGPPLTDYSVDIHFNWTAGCTALKNRDIDELYRAVRVGTPVDILP